MSEPAESGHERAAERAPLPAATADGRHDGHGSPHPAEHCASGLPQQGAAVTHPGFAVQVRKPVTPVRPTLKPGLTGVELHGASAVDLRSSVVQQV
ncbi:hypothetical protein G5C60_32660 [Streptomyces sp. HC44]|uniref:Uncharacterized protein n=1 Tax=Streptomyces scabichelini TaxID=2711217 RepID=A0A6G4VDN0_9ACTN|nr:hypothetical protein [Streptomyces scabichelini]NGO12232.1 hypothetical protein [Streptomyces scabichelini]